MLNINFVPDDYVHNHESTRTNIMYVVLLLLVIAGLGVAFMTIEIRQKACAAEEQLVNEKMASIQQQITKFEQLQIRRKAMMKNALTTAELLEPVPRSVLLASLTNNLPMGASLAKLKVTQKMPPPPPPAPPKPGAPPQPKEPEASREKLIETHIDIEGIAPSDLQVAEYIERLGGSTLLQNVALIESLEYKVDDTTFRRFKLKAMLKKDIHLTKDDVEEIRAKARQSFGTF